MTQPEPPDKPPGKAKTGRPPTIIVNIVLLVILAVWAVSVIADIFKSDYTPPAGVNETFGIVSAFLFVGSRSLNGNGKGAQK